MVLGCDRNIAASKGVLDGSHNRILSIIVTDMNIVR
jgi:hypothetical protein